MYCSKCGTETGDDAQFCARCGSSIKPADKAESQEKPTSDSSPVVPADDQSNKTDPKAQSDSKRVWIIIGGFIVWIILISAIPGTTALLSVAGVLAATFYWVTKVKAFRWMWLGTIVFCLFSSCVGWFVHDQQAKKRKAQEQLAKLTEDNNKKFDALLTEAKSALDAKKYDDTLTKLSAAEALTPKSRPDSKLQSLRLDAAALSGDKKAVDAAVKSMVATLSEAELVAAKLPSALAAGHPKEVVALLEKKFPAAAKARVAELKKLEKEKLEKLFADAPGTTAAERYPDLLKPWSACHDSKGDLTESQELSHFSKFDKKLRGKAVTVLGKVIEVEVDGTTGVTMELEHPTGSGSVDQINVKLTTNRLANESDKFGYGKYVVVTGKYPRSVCDNTFSLVEMEIKATKLESPGDYHKWVTSGKKSSSGRRRSASKKLTPASCRNPTNFYGYGGQNESGLCLMSNYERELDKCKAALSCCNRVCSGSSSSGSYSSCLTSCAVTAGFPRVAH